MKRFILGSLVLAIVLATGVAQADFINMPVKWSQTPDMDTDSAGYKKAEHPEMWGAQIVADDWMCTSPYPVVAVRWWGMYLNTGVKPLQTGQPWTHDSDGDGVNDSRYLDFEIVFHSDDPLDLSLSTPINSQLYEYSTPLGMLTGYDIVEAQESYYGTIPDSTTIAGWDVYEYNAWLDVPFEQEVGTIYWIDIEFDEFGFYGGQEPLDSDGNSIDTWAWMTTTADQAALDKAVYGPTHLNGPWEIFTCHNMAFEVMVPVPGAVLLGILGLSAAGIKLRRFA